MSARTILSHAAVAERINPKVCEAIALNAAGARAVLDGNEPPPALAQLLADEAHEDVILTAGTPVDDLHRVARETILRERE